MLSVVFDTYSDMRSKVIEEEEAAKEKEARERKKAAGYTVIAASPPAGGRDDAEDNSNNDVNSDRLCGSEQNGGGSGISIGYSSEVHAPPTSVVPDTSPDMRTELRTKEEQSNVCISDASGAVALAAGPEIELPL